MIDFAMSLQKSAARVRTVMGLYCSFGISVVYLIEFLKVLQFSA